MTGNPLELALSALAKSMGVALPGMATPLGGAERPNDMTKNEENQPDELSKSSEKHAAPAGEEEEEEGEVKDGAHSSLPTKQAPRLKKSKKVVPERRIVDFTGAVDAESLLRGSSQKTSKKPRHEPPPHPRPSSEAAEEPVKPTPRVPCRYWMKGQCSKGDECTFSHAIKPNRTAEEAKSEEVCRFHILGNCLKGEACLYSHDLSKVPCKFFHVRGECAAGEACRFSHAPISDEVRRQLFVESMGVRDPRLGGGSAAPEAVQIKSPPPVREAPPDHFMSMSLSPAVARLNPFGSPF